ncbi:MAG: hypothetical protein K6G80_10935 [Treponema sp.]|nr:hypothetical protein [Treponema sp.]
MDKSSVIFGNRIDAKTLRKAAAQQKKFLKKFGDDRNTPYHLKAVDNDVLTPAFGAKVLVLTDEPSPALPEKAIIIGNIRMGFGHYRISMAMASAAHALGYTPLWLDLNSFPETTGTKIIAWQNRLYSMASRLSQKSRLFNKLVWDPLNTEGFKKLTYNAVDQKTSELMTPILHDLPRETPFIATHVWPSQAAIHAGFTHVVNAIPDNWAMALHLSEGARHTVQTPSTYQSYRMLKGFAGDKVLTPMAADDIAYTGQYIDDELVANIESDCKMRLERLSSHTSPQCLRFLLTIGGAGAQGDYFANLIQTLLPYIMEKRACLYLNIGDYENMWQFFKEKLPEIVPLSETHFNDWTATKAFAEKALRASSSEPESHGIHVFCHTDIFAAVYATNLLLRASDVLITKPSELAFYPVPKLMIQHVGGHECWGAIRAAELGDGTPECPNLAYAQTMLKTFIESPDLLQQMNMAIISNKKAGIYNGAYHAVELAAGTKESNYEWPGRQ